MSAMSVTCERILERINNEKLGAFTSSDFSDIDNYKITKDMIIGIVNFKIPYVGYPTIWLNEL